MATISKTFRGIASTTAETEMNNFVAAYWGTLEKEKMFPIPFWKAKRLIKASNTGEVALRITDIEIPGEVDGNWLVFEGIYEDVLQDPNLQEDVHYFVLQESTLDDIQDNIATPYEHIIWGRIGKSPTGTFHAFFNSALCKLVKPGTGSEGTSNGFKIPAT